MSFRLVGRGAECWAGLRRLSSGGSPPTTAPMRSVEAMSTAAMCDTPTSRGKYSTARAAGWLPAMMSGMATACKQPLQLILGDGHSYVRLSTSGRGWFAKAVRLSQKDDETFPRVTPHDLRHTAASLAVSAGANVNAVQRMLGHASAAMALDTYADLFDDDLDAVAVGLDTSRSSRIVSMSVSTAPKPYAKEPLLPRFSRDVEVLSLAVLSGICPRRRNPARRVASHGSSVGPPGCAQTRQPQHKKKKPHTSGASSFGGPGGI